ncbi:unnamed protein product [Musa acuminata var. zebrina]
MGARRCTLEAGFNSLLAPVASESGDDLREIDSENPNCCNLSCGDKRMRLSSSGLGRLQEEALRLNSELWHACAGPLVSLPPVGSRVVYFPQGHSELVAASTNRVTGSLPSFPSLPPHLVCQLHNVTMLADEETDEVYAQMTLQALISMICNVKQNDLHLPTELGTRSKHPTNYFRKTLTASDTSTHGCCSIPRRAAEKVFPPLDFSRDPPVQELIAKDLHGNEWKFRHTFRGQPKRHLLTIGWTLFVNAKRLVAGDSVIFIWYGYSELLLGVRRAQSPQRVASADAVHVGLVAAHAVATNSSFTLSYFPRASPSEFVIPLSKYVKAVLRTRLLVGMRFRMLFETSESSVRRYMGKIIGIGDLDPVRWPNSHWRSVKVSWDEHAVGERQFRVSPWEIEPLPTFPMYPSPFPLGMKHSWPTAVPCHHGEDDDNVDLASPLMCFQNGGNLGFLSLNAHSSAAAPWMQPRFDAPMLQAEMWPMAAASGLLEKRVTDAAKQASAATLQPQQTPTPLGQSLDHGGPPPPAFLQIAQLNLEQILHQQAQQRSAATTAAVVPPVQSLLLPPPPPPVAYADFSPSIPPLQSPYDTYTILHNSTDATLPAYSLTYPIDLTSEDILSLHPSFHSSLESLPPLEVCIHRDSVGGELITRNNERFFF